MFQPVKSRAEFPEVEKRILDFWKANQVFERSLEERKGGPLFVLYDGPPTANATPGIHHVLARVFKDVIPRYKTMKGFYAPRKAGWDTHGLPVELEVERELGLKSKPEIEAYGVAEFNARCRQSVLGYIKDWERLTDSIGFWLDMEHPYITLENGYIESCWWIIKQLWESGLIYQGYRVTPHCPRCGTSLSSHEVALGYEEDTPDPSVYIKFRLAQRQGSQPLPAELPAYLLAWTTTPWTLPGNTALAVAPGAEYSVLDLGTERLILASALVKSTGLEGYPVLARLAGAELVGLRYEPLFPPVNYKADVYRFHRPEGGRALLEKSYDPRLVPEPGKGLPELDSYPVIGADFVSMTDGTGIVHIAPAFGEVDYQAGEERGLYFVQPVDLEGKMTGSYPFAGKFVKEADPLILADLRARGLLYKSETIRHTYPFCWRCHTPLLYYAKPSWYIKTTAVKDRLIRGNEEINWYPEHIKYGRFGDWLENNVDWAFSRERYWGTPLPIWRCQGCGHEECIGSQEELRQKEGLEHNRSSQQLLLGDLDLHRPFVDEIVYRCSKCGGSMRRLPEVIDCWFDSGAMPVAQWHYPFENKDLLKERFPADYICEAVDQTRGWFYSLHALSTLLFDSPCFRNVICLGHILDSKGEKMSKSKGNVVNPWSLLDRYGADALRWYLFTACPPGNVRRFAAEYLEEAVRQFMLTLWNTYSFFVTYANIDRFDPSAAPAAGAYSELDRWILSELNQLVESVDRLLEHYDPMGAGRRIEDFVDILSNWYVRRSRRRFWKSENDADKLAAYSTLHRCLATLSKLLAPFTPFLAEEIYQNLVRPALPEAPLSVHLTDFPMPELALIDEELEADTRTVMKVCSLGRAARSKANLKVRQPLARVLVKARSKREREGLARLGPQILDELNVKEMELIEDDSIMLDYEIKPNLMVVGRKYTRDVPKIAAALAASDPREVAGRAARGEIIVAGTFRLLPEDVLVITKEKPGYAVAGEVGLEVGVTTQVTPELAAEGKARELVHRLQTMRRSAGFDIADHIVTYYQAGDSLQRVIETYAPYLKQETLSRELVSGSSPPDAYVESHSIDGEEVVLGVVRA